MAFVGLTGPAAQAVSIPVPNNSFEEGDAIRTGGGVPQWSFQADSASGTLYRDIGSYPATPGNPTTNHYVGFFNGTPNQIAQAFTNSSVTTIAANTQYTLTVALGNVANAYNGGNAGDVNDYDEGGEYRIEMFNNLTRDDGTANGDGTTYQLASLKVNGATIADGSLQDFSVSFTTGDAATDPNVGLPLYIQIQAKAIGSALNGFQSTFDDVRLDAVGVPEPTTIALLSLAGLPMLSRRRR